MLRKTSQGTAIITIIISFVQAEKALCFSKLMIFINNCDDGAHKPKASIPDLSLFELFLLPLCIFVDLNATNSGQNPTVI
jgi:hypothetical protein